MSEAITQGKAVYTEMGVAVFTTRPDLPNLSDDVRVLWSDSRSISPDQRRKAWALMGEIAAYQGQSKEETYAEQKSAFTLKHLEILQDGLFRLSTATVSQARAYITMLIDIVIENGIPTKEPLAALCEDISKYVYSCLVNKKCAVCGKKAELHHVDAVGMGFDRTQINHIGKRCLPLCREHHNEWHKIGGAAFESKYHLIPIKIDERIAKAYRLKGERA